MKKFFNKRNITIFSVSFTILFLLNLPLITKNIISADILLNNFYYNGYSWELSLGRFGLYIIGILKSFITIPHIDLLISYSIISISILLLISLFNIKDKKLILLFILIIALSPITSSTLLFNYCSIGYSLAFLCSILSIYIFYNEKNKYIKYLVPIILIVISLSMYQAYLSVIITTFVIYNIKLLLDKKELKESLKYLVLLIIGVLSYFIIMKLTLLIFNINMSSYSNANEIGINTIFNLPNKIVESYKLFYEFFFTNKIMKNTYLHNNIINLLLLIFTFIQILLILFKEKIKTKNKVLILLLLLTLPIYLNSIIFVIEDTKLQLLMSSAYLLIPLLTIITLPKNKFKYLSILLFILLFRNYSVQIQSTYLSLENTFNKYNTVISSSISNNINNLDYEFAVIGKDKINKNNDINKLNYGFISDDSIFWDEYNLRSLGFERFCYEYYGLKIDFVSESKYQELSKVESSKELTYTKDNIIIINLDNLK